MDLDLSHASSELIPGQMGPQASEAPVPRLALVCDDDPAITHLVARVARRLGVTCLEAGTAEAIQGLALAHPSALIVLDLSLGRGDAVQVLKFLKEHRFAGSLVLISGHEQAVLDHVTAIGRRHGLTMRQPIRKPFTPDAVREVLYGEGLVTAAKPNAMPLPELPQCEKSLPGSPAIIPNESKDVLGHDQLDLRYRPVVSLSDYRATGIETRPRFVDGSGGALDLGGLMDRLSPDETGLLTRSLVARARTDWESLAGEGLNLRFALNVPSSEVLSGRFCEVVKRYGSDDPRWPGFLIEIREDCLDGAFESLREELVRLRLYKVDFAVANLGRVSSRYETYKKLEIGELKLDRAFVHGCADDSYKAALCGAAVELGRKLGARVTAKGLEGAADLALVRSFGCANGQGDVLSPALPFDKLAELLRPGTPLYRPKGSGPAKAAAIRA